MDDPLFVVKQKCLLLKAWENNDLKSSKSLYNTLEQWFPTGVPRGAAKRCLGCHQIGNYILFNDVLLNKVP